MKRQLVFSAFLLLAVLALAGMAAEPLPRAAPESVGLRAATLREATALLNRFVGDGVIAGAVAAVARGGRLAYLEAVGVQDLETRTPMTDRTLFRIYSMTKPVTAVAVMMLHEEGRFALDDPVAKYVPEFAQVMVRPPSDGAARRPARDVTIRDLLLHTSGLNHRTSEIYRRAAVRSRTSPLPRFIENIVQVGLMEDPGTRYRYSEGTTVLGRLVEVWSGRPFDAFLEARLLEPLDMTDTAFWVGPDRRSRLAAVYGAAQGDGLRRVEIEELPFTERPALVEGAVGLVSTVPDYLRFSQMLLNRGALDGVRVLRPETVDLMAANGLPADVLKARGGGLGWGLANVNVVLDPAARPYPANRGEYGWDGSAGTIFWVDPAKQLVTILMTQSSPPNPGSLRERFKTIVQQAVVD
jgi:CubicO group peptidase (beta-lactamase class C family)